MPFLFINSLPSPPDRRINVSLHLHTKNTTAKKFYERLGLEEKERIGGYYTSNGGLDSEAIVMQGVLKFPLIV
ncbi:hypothetical protein BT69DRAFT_1282269 [Atractiella rhizophila]|nr:hypothetical protein BT69DRAFT_1282269 [Atractiella rhizophila]